MRWKGILQKIVQIVSLHLKTFVSMRVILIVKIILNKVMEEW